MEAMTTETPLYEAGVHYCHGMYPVTRPVPKGMTPYRYNRRFLVNGRTSTQTVYLYDFQDLYRLLDHWNRDHNWKFWAAV